MIVASASVGGVLLLLKILFLVLLYLFIWRIVRSASRDLRLPQESFILPPPQRAQQPSAPRGPAPASVPGRLVVVQSPALPAGAGHTLDSRTLTIGRGAQNDVQLEGDEFVSARHARIEPRGDGVFVEDVGSTNGTFVNGVRLTGPRQLQPGDVIRIGETDLRFER